MREIRPVSDGPSLAGYFQQLLNHIIVLRLSINANATGQGGDLENPAQTQLLAGELADQLEALRGDAATMITGLRQSFLNLASKKAVSKLT